MLSFQQVTLARGPKLLLEKVSATIYEKQKIGLVGHNGCGKSSLFQLILGQLSPDEGECQLNPKLVISVLAQQLPDSEEPALQFVLAGDSAYMQVQQHLEKAEQVGDAEEIVHCHELLKQMGGYGKPAQAAAIMSGLGFKPEEQQRSVNSFSGGWRMRLSLARCLMQPADLMLLDEPTNHLDMEAIFWLEKWLKQTPATVLVISHDREFLDAFVTYILHIEHKNLALYSGNYSRFEQTRAQQLALQQATYEKQQAQIKHLMDFVSRFKAKASKAKQAQSRLKLIAKMDIVAQAQSDSPFSFQFFPAAQTGKTLLGCEKVQAGYCVDKPILRDIQLTLYPGDRIALLGANGAGKSTLIKTLTGKLKPLSGEITYSPHLQVGYYAQHQLEELDNRLSPLETIQVLSPMAREQIIRDFLGGFNFWGDMAVNSIQHFSGGEKARLALAKLVWQKPNLLLLDEPTNHLDLGMRAAIEIALQSYEGALILISHDRHLLRTCVNDFYLVDQQRVQSFAGDLDDYYQWLMNKSDSSKSQSTSTNAQAFKERKTLLNRQKKVEQLLGESEKRLAALEERLADGGLYVTERQSDLAQLLNEQNKEKEAFQRLENEWLMITQEIEG